MDSEICIFFLQNKEILYTLPAKGISRTTILNEKYQSCSNHVVLKTKSFNDPSRQREAGFHCDSSETYRPARLQTCNGSSH